MRSHVAERLARSSAQLILDSIAVAATAAGLWQHHWPAAGALTATIGISTRLVAQAGYYEPKRRLIVLSRKYHEHYGDAELVATLLHELVHHHVFLAFGDRVRPHGPEFRAEAERVGCPRHCLDLAPLKRLRLLCPHCGREFWRQRRPPRGGLACGPCCARYAGGRFDRRFRLVQG